MPQPVVAEIAYGIARLPRSKRRDWLEQRFTAITETIDRVEWTDGVSRAFGEIKAWLERKGRSIEDFDVAIAAHALAHDATLVTANVKHVTGIPKLLVEDWSRAT